MAHDDRYYMGMALDLARKGQGFTSPNPMVGALVVKEGRVVGEGYHRSAGQAHAEIVALREAGESAQGATLYVTLEPCNHVGRTPPCTRAVVRAGIKRAVVAMKDPNPDVAGGGAEYLSGVGIEVILGVCEDQARRLNEFFVKYVRTKRPFVIVKCAATLDGRIATRTGDSKWVTGEPAREFVHHLRHAVDAIMVGINTIKTDNPRLTTRLKNVASKDPIRIVLDSRLTIPFGAQVLTVASDAETWIVTGDNVSTEKSSALERKNVRVLAAPLKRGRIDLDSLMTRLGALGITSLLIEGGSRVLASAFRARIVDKVVFFYAPKILGGDDGVPICTGPGPLNMRDCIPVNDVRAQCIGQDVMIEGYLTKPGSPA
jgi:diaminohydroxyphosphoribosylaminopyrimidine deaminase / 5-amino-6-(5-phosphoribosylamino)uracil reductase